MFNKMSYSIRKVSLKVPMLRFKVWKNDISEILQIQRVENSKYWCNAFLHFPKRALTLTRGEGCTITGTLLVIEHLTKDVSCSFGLDKQQTGWRSVVAQVLCMQH